MKNDTDNKSEKLKNVISLINLALRETPKGSNATAALIDARKILNSLGSYSPIQKLSTAIGEFTKPNYFEWFSFWDSVNCLLAHHEFEPIARPAQTKEGRSNFLLNSADGTIQTYLAVYWYQMESGRHEFVAYITI